MKSVLQSTVAWVNSKLKKEVHHIVPTSNAKSAEVLTFTAPPKVEVPSVLYSGGPELVLTKRGPKLYGTCPHCTTMFNIRERIMRRRLSTLDQSKPLSCPQCSQIVSLPGSVDLRKLS